jgi:hypothetical protein
VVVTAGRDPNIIRTQFKAWCTRKLNDLQRARHAKPREEWWGERGSKRRLDDEESLEAAIRYVLECQD